MAKSIWLRKETKSGEERSPLSPQGVKQLSELGIKVFVESSEQRVFKDQEFIDVGAEVVFGESFESAPENALIIGLKELPQSSKALSHEHLYFAHAFKEQAGSASLLKRFQEGGGSLIDLEFITDSQGKRVAAFGRWAGYAGAGLGIDIWCHDKIESQHSIESQPLGYVQSFSDRKTFLNHIHRNLEIVGLEPSILIIGARGRSGRGAFELVRELGLNATLWGRKETSKENFKLEILNYDILINCMLVDTDTPLLFSRQSLNKRRKLSVIADISCDPTSPYNPIPIYDHATTFDSPVKRFQQINSNNHLSLMAIDHLPSLLPRESSIEFSEQLLPHLVDYLKTKSQAFENSKKKFLETSHQILIREQVQNLQN